MIVLNMIVKNEESVIARCLDSLKEMIDALVISDTGSTDNTIQVIQKWQLENNKPGIVTSHEWKNFEWNRNLALQDCKNWISQYCLENRTHSMDSCDILLIDADDIFVLEDLDEYNKSLDSEADCLWIDMKMDGTIFSRPFIFRADIESKWIGILHEFCQVYGNRGSIKGAFVQVSRDGARNKNPVKYLNDAVTLERELKDRYGKNILNTELSGEKDIMSARYIFYLAQSYRDSGYFSLAEKIYLKRFEIEIYDEERYIALLEAAKCRIRRNKRDDKTLKYLMRAFNFRPERLEAAFYLVEHYRLNDMYHLGYYFGKNFLDMKPPIIDTLFIENDIYEHKMKDDVAVCACWIGDKKLFNELYQELLKKQLPEETKKRIQEDLVNFGK
jgi:glycosyltransferase involved in cell wall biosynthesis